MEYVDSARDILSSFMKLHVDMFHEDPSFSIMNLVFTVLVLVFLPLDTKMWLFIHSALFLLEGTYVLFFPGQFHSQIVQGDTVDGLHLQELRCVGIMMITLAMSFYFLHRNSSDPTAHSTLVLAHTMLIGFLCLLQGQAVYSFSAKKKGNNFKQNVATISLHYCVLLFAGHLYHLLRVQDWGGYMEVVSSRRNFHLRLDFVMWMMFGVLAFVFPKVICEFQVNSKMDTVHAFYARLMGAYFITLSMLSCRASNFLREEDKKSVLLSHAFAEFLFLLTMGLCQLFTDIFTPWHAFFGMTCVLLSLTNALMGCEPRYLASQTLKKLQTLVPTSKTD